MANGIVLGGSLRCRQNPSTSATIYGSFANGTVISVTSYNSGWYQTTWTTGSTGYVMKDFVAIVGDTVQVTKNNVNVRSGAGTSYGLLYQLSSPTTATVKGMSSGWVKIKPASYSEGWMSASYLKKKTSGSSGGGGSVYPGVTGSGHNSTITAADIRANTGKYWKKDTSTYHPQIKKLQEKIWHYCYSKGLNFSEYGPLTADGIYGNDTYQYVNIYQFYRGLNADGIVGYYTLNQLESDEGPIN